MKTKLRATLRAAVRATTRAPHARPHSVQARPFPRLYQWCFRGRIDTLAVPAATTQRATPPNPPRGRPLPGIAVTFLFVHWFRPFHAPGPSPAPKQVSSYKFDLASATQIDMIFLVVVALPVQRNLQMVLFTLVLYVHTQGDHQAQKG